MWKIKVWWLTRKLRKIVRASIREDLTLWTEKRAQKRTQEIWAMIEKHRSRVFCGGLGI